MLWIQICLHLSQYAQGSCFLKPAVRESLRKFWGAQIIEKLHLRIIHQHGLHAREAGLGRICLKKGTGYCTMLNKTTNTMNREVQVTDLATGDTFVGNEPGNSKTSPLYFTLPTLATSSTFSLPHNFSAIVLRALFPLPFSPDFVPQLVVEIWHTFWGSPIQGYTRITCISQQQNRFTFQPIDSHGIT